MSKIYYRNGNEAGTYPELLSRLRFQKTKEQEKEISLDEVLEGAEKLKTSISREYNGKDQKQLLLELMNISKMTRNIGQNLRADFAIIDFYNLDLENTKIKNYNGRAEIRFYSKS